MKRATKIVVIGIIALLSVSAFAQRGGGGGGGQGRGFGGNSMTGLLNRSDVQKELKITADQKSKLDALREQQRAAFGGGPGGRQGGGQGQGGQGQGGQGQGGQGQGGGATAQDREAMMKQFQEARAKMDKDTLAILDDTQKKRLKELWVQRSGNGVLSNEDIQKELGLTDDQKTKIKDLQAKQREANQQIMERVRNQEIEREEARSLQDKNNKILNEELGKVLTAEQSAKLKEMGGAPFKFEDNAGGGN